MCFDSENNDNTNPNLGGLDEELLEEEFTNEVDYLEAYACRDFDKIPADKMDIIEYYKTTSVEWAGIALNALSEIRQLEKYNPNDDVFLFLHDAQISLDYLMETLFDSPD